MAQIIKRKRSDGSHGYLVRIRRLGLPSMVRTFDRRVDAEDWAAEIEGRVVTGDLAPIRDGERYTLGELIDLFVDGPLIRKPSNQIPQLRARLSWWKNALGRHSIGQIRPPDVAVCKARLLSEKVSMGRGRAALRRRGEATVNRYLTALSIVYRWAKDHLHLDVRNPVMEVAREREPRGRERVLSTEEQLRWLEAARHDAHPAAYPLVAALCATGARLGELLYLERTSVVLEPPGQEHLRIRVGSVRGTTKNRMIRAVPLWWQPKAVEILRDWAGQMTAGRVFDLPMSTAQKVIGRTTATAELPGVTSHVVRHTVATQLAEAGFTTPQLMAFFGWRTSAMADRYVHAVPDRMLKSLPMDLASRFRLE